MLETAFFSDFSGLANCRRNTSKNNNVKAVLLINALTKIILKPTSNRANTNSPRVSKITSAK